MLRIGVLASGGGTNFQAIVDSIEDGYLKECNIVSVVSNRKEAFIFTRAKRHNIPTSYIPKGKKSIEEYDRLLIDHFTGLKVDLIVMAGFLCIMGSGFVDFYKNKIINVHPSLIPSFCGKGYYGLIPHKKALEYGVKITGATVHFVEIDTDAGPIILQKAVEVRDSDTPEILQKRVMEEAEWVILPEAIKLISQNRLKIDGRRVIIKEQ